MFGTVFTGQDLTATQNQVFSASSTFSGLAADQTFSTLNSNQFFGAPAGTTFVVDVTNLNLNNASIYLQGQGYYVLNVTGSFRLQGLSRILDTGADDSHVFINYTGSSPLQVNGSGDGIGDDVIGGALFIPTANAMVLNGDHCRSDAEWHP